MEVTDFDYKYGFHMTKHPSMLKTVKEVVDNTDLSAMQIYIMNSRGKVPPKFCYPDLMAARRLAKMKFMYLVIHGSLLYNLAGTTKGSTDPKYTQSLNSTLSCLTAELDFGVAIDAGVVIHPGSCKLREEGLKDISKSINTVLTRETEEIENIAEKLDISVKKAISKRKVILENAAGEGTKLCSTLDEIRTVIDGVKEYLRPQVRVCIDTAHAFGRGLYDWGKDGEISRFYSDFDKVIGLEYLEVFHFNDSMIDETNKGKNAPFGSRKDRHQQLGLGYIFGSEERFPKITEFMLYARKHGIPVIGEPPMSGKMDWENVKKLLSKTEYPLQYTI